MKAFSSRTLVSGIALLALGVILGCESADVDPDNIGTSPGGGDTPSGQTPGGSGGGTGETVEIIAVDPASAVHTSVGDFTVLEVEAVAGYTFTWTISDTNLGTLSPITGNKTTYFTKSIPATGSKIQTITVTGRSQNPGATVVYRGTCAITHRAP